MAGKGLVVTGLALLACMGESFMLAAPSQARGALINSGWLSSGKVVRATSSRSEVRPCFGAPPPRMCSDSLVCC